MSAVWGWLEWAGIIAAMWAVFALGLGVMIGRALRRRQPMPPLGHIPPPGDYVPDEWVAEYERQNRERP